MSSRTSAALVDNSEPSGRTVSPLVNVRLEMLMLTLISALSTGLFLLDSRHVLSVNPQSASEIITSSGVFLGR